MTEQLIILGKYTYYSTFICIQHAVENLEFTVNYMYSKRGLRGHAFTYVFENLFFGTSETELQWSLQKRLDAFSLKIVNCIRLLLFS